MSVADPGGGNGGVRLDREPSVQSDLLDGLHQGMQGRISNAGIDGMVGLIRRQEQKPIEDPDDIITTFFAT